MKFHPIILFVLALILVSPALAEVTYNHELEAITDLNAIPPLQNPGYDPASQILGRRILDNKNKVIGEVRDVILNSNGSIASLDVDFNRLRLQSQVYLNYREMNIRPASNAYIVGFNDKQIEDLYPQLIANIETAAGEEDIYSARTLIGTNVQNDKGLNIGKVEELIFGADGNRAEGLYIALTQGNLRGKKIAIPFEMADMDKAASEKTVRLNAAEADALMAYAKAH